MLQELCWSGAVHSSVHDCHDACRDSIPAIHNAIQVIILLHAQESRSGFTFFFSSFFTYIRSTSRVHHSGLTPRPRRVDHDMTSILFFSVQLVFFRFTLGQQQVSSLLPYHFKETETVLILYILVRFELTPSSPTHCAQNFIPQKLVPKPGKLF